MVSAVNVQYYLAQASGLCAVGRYPNFGSTQRASHSPWTLISTVVNRTRPDYVLACNNYNESRSGVSDVQLACLRAVAPVSYFYTIGHNFKIQAQAMFTFTAVVRVAICVKVKTMVRFKNFKEHT